jgi:transposase
MRNETDMLKNENALLKEINATLLAKNEFLKHQIGTLHQLVEEYRKAKYAPKSEEFVNQPGLFNEAEAETDDKQKLKDEIDVKGHKKRKGGRRPIPEHYPRTRKEYDLAEHEKICACGHSMNKIGEEISEKIEIVPASVEVIQHARFKYACPGCKEKIKTAQGPLHPIPKSFASASFLANVATSKYVDGLPLYRQEAILKRMDLEIKRGTLARWMIEVGKLVTPLINLIIDQIIASRVINMDETKIQVLKEKGKKASSLSYVWVVVRPAADRPAVYFEYSPSRSGKVATRILQDYDGYIVTDDYRGYSTAMKETPHKHCGCWDHCRRYFFDAFKSTDKDLESLPAYALNLLKSLYAVERRYKPQGTKRLIIARRLYSRGILAVLKKWIDRNRPIVPPKSPTGKALRYADENWHKLLRFLEDPEIPISNEKAENAIRPFVIGRKNWLFSDTTSGADASANIYSLVESAKVNGLDPFWYLSRVIEGIPYCRTLEDFDKLLPWNIDLKPAVTSKSQTMH